MLTEAPKSRSHPLSRRSGMNRQATAPLLACTAKTCSAQEASFEKLQSAESKTTSPEDGITLPDDQMLPQPSFRGSPFFPASVTSTQTGSPVSRLAPTSS